MLKEWSSLLVVHVRNLTTETNFRLLERPTNPGLDQALSFYFYFFCNQWLVFSKDFSWNVYPKRVSTVISEEGPSLYWFWMFTFLEEDLRVWVNPASRSKVELEKFCFMHSQFPSWWISFLACQYNNYSISSKRETISRPMVAEYAGAALEEFLCTHVPAEVAAHFIKNTCQLII